MTHHDSDIPAKGRLNTAVFFGSAVCIVLFAFWAMFFTDSANTVIFAMLGWIADTFGWYYFLAGTLYLAFVVFIACSRFGSIRLGPKHSKPEFSLMSWASMLFAAGIGIDLLFFCVAEPVTQFLAPPTGTPETMAAARQATVWSLFHYGITGWAMYALMGMVLAYFSFRYNLPLTIRSALYPIFGKRVEGAIGHTVDIAAVLGTVFGIATSLGIGVVQLNYGLTFLFDIPSSLVVQGGLIVLSIVLATISVVAGVDKGIRRISEFNVLLALALLLFVLVEGKTLFLLNALVLNIGDYLSQFMSMTMDTMAFQQVMPETAQQTSDWLNAWTLFFWAWWVAWAPFVGLFLARISRGRTIREFVVGTLTIPFIFTLLWMSIFGNSAIEMILSGNADFGVLAMNNPEQGFYALLSQYPAITWTASLATLLGMLFYVTSADSGALVLGNFTSILPDPHTDAPTWLRVFWSIVIGLLTFALLLTNGVSALQSMVVVMGLPFSFVMFFVIAGLWKSLRMEGFREDSRMGSLAGHLSSRSDSAHGAHLDWRKRLGRAMNFSTLSQVSTFQNEVCRPAMDEVCKELSDQGVPAEIIEGDEKVPHLALNVVLDDEQNFTYQTWPRQFETPEFARRAKTEQANYYRMEVYLQEGSQGYDLMGYSKEQVIDDILDQYERHLHFLHMSRDAPGTPATLPDDPELPA
ncbi:choline BCCT transporter BetT [Larsenimonas suaedae]|uniref:Choline BCCT transporter BetT n=1 Tax=Larsenimonas suaedae TaxID=1851019 RepID=A0ABU1GVH7_9GAMM|nr:choline BCCT transporter BetT [Larsenimonas suaedae]MCM2972010.1 choline BCCT transporter BetT [Larsenimonas suaedae]MDR5895562.1 choline BCCT transporter BetT [Larsenimonas suaedae]